VVCAQCRDAGYLRADVPVGHPNFGKPIACPCQQARKNEARRKRLREQSQLDTLAVFREASFATFNPLLEGVLHAYNEAVRFAQQPHGWLVLEGGNGCGKTHLAVAIAKSCLDEGMIVLFAVVPDLLDYLRATFAPNAEEPYDEAFAKMREAQLLVLDDLGAEQSTPWANEKLYQLLNCRYNARLPTVMTTNKIGLVGIENRIRSRLSDRRLVRMVTMAQAQDFRLLEEVEEREEQAWRS
jgi:DNA replication protein DnaC